MCVLCLYCRQTSAFSLLHSQTKQIIIKRFIYSYCMEEIVVESHSFHIIIDHHLPFVNLVANQTTALNDQRFVIDMQRFF